MSAMGGGKEQDERLTACRSLTGLLESRRGFSFLRLGDSELRFLIDVPAGKWSDAAYAADRYQASVENALGTSGLRRKDYARLLSAYEGCDYLDYYDHQESNRKLLPQVTIKRRKETWDNRGVATSGIINDWTLYEWPLWQGRHRCLLYGAEAGLLQELLKDATYRGISGDIVTCPENLIFATPPERGLHASRDLEVIKREIAELIGRHRCDTLLLSLGGPAKIICHELSTELAIRALDWGSMMRALTYSGSDGYATWRSSHNPFFFRVPFEVYMTALTRAAPSETPAFYVGKAHAQLALETQRREIGRTFSADVHDSDSLDRSTDARFRFRESFRSYKKWLEDTGYSNDPAMRELLADFRRWRLFRGLNWDGRIFRCLFYFKNRVKNMLSQGETGALPKRLRKLSQLLFGRVSGSGQSD